MSGEALKAFYPFADLADGEREELAALLEERDLSPDETLFVEGEEADALVLVTSGTVHLSSSRAPERATVGPGTVLGACALFAVGSREVSAVAAERARVLLLRREEYLRAAEDAPRVACRIAMAIAGELAGQARAAVRQLASASVDPSGGGE